jgi:hypothetical protein
MLVGSGRTFAKHGRLAVFRGFDWFADTGRSAQYPIRMWNSKFFAFLPFIPSAFRIQNACPVKEMTALWFLRRRSLPRPGTGRRPPSGTSAHALVTHGEGGSISGRPSILMEEENPLFRGF